MSFEVTHPPVNQAQWHSTSGKSGKRDLLPLCREKQRYILSRVWRCLRGKRHSFAADLGELAEVEQ